MKAPPRRCSKQGCRAFTPCPDHGGDSTRRGYDWRWEQTRRTALDAHPICELCGQREAVHVDHMDGRGPKGPRGHDPTNLQALCASCHARLTRADQG